MARRENKHVNIENTELKPTTIGYISNKKKSSWPLILIFIILIAVVYFLPEITEYIENYREEKNVNNGDVNNVTPEVDEDDSTDNIQNDEVEKSAYTENLILTEELFSIEKIILEEENSSFVIVNTAEEEINFTNGHYYLEIFTEDNTLITRISLDKAGKIDVEEDYEFTTGSVTNAKYLRIMRIMPEDYPSINLNIDEDSNMQNLVCTLEETETIYLFEDNKLKKIESTTSISVDDDNYDSNVSFYNSMHDSLGVIVGIETDMRTSNDITYFITEVDLTEYKETDEYELTFELDTLAKDINFISESNGEECK